MYELWLLLVKICRKVYDKTIGPLWSKFLGKVIPYDVAFDAACRKSERDKANGGEEGLWSRLRTPILSACAGAAVTVLLTHLLKSCK